MTKSSVSIVKTCRNPQFPEIKSKVREALDLIGGIQDIIKPDCRVLINPSWVAPPVDREAGCITIPEIPRALADIIREMNAHPIIAESSAVGVDCEKLVRESGYQELRLMGYDVMNLKETPHVALPTGNGKIFKTVDCWQAVQEADVIISVPKLKTHDQTEMTCAIKKLKGLLTDKAKKAMHQEGLFDGVVDLLCALKPSLAVVDAIICQEGLGPIFGKPVEMNLIMAGKDLVAVDAVCARLIGVDPAETLLTVNAAERGLGVMDADRIKIVGATLNDVKHSFLRPIEDDPVQVDGFELIHDEATCTGCRNTVMSALVDMRNSDQLDYLPGVTVVTGDAPLPEGVPQADIVTVGKCMGRENRTERYVKGCPPNNVQVVRAIIGARAEVKRMYSDTGEEIK